MAKVINQNDVVAVIQSSVTCLNNVADVIFKAAQHSAIANGGINNIAAYTNNINILFSKNGAVTSILNVMHQVLQLSKIKTSKRAIRRLAKNIKVFFKELKALVRSLSESTAETMPTIDGKNTNATLNSLFGKNGVVSEVLKSMEIIVKLSNTKISKRTIRRLAKNIRVFFKELEGINSTVAAQNGKAAPKFDGKGTSSMLSSVIEIFKMVNEMSAVKLWWKLKMLKYALIRIARLMPLFHQIQPPRKATNNVLKLNLVVGGIGTLFTSIVLLAPVWIAGVPATLLLFVALKVFSVLFRFVVSTIISIASKKAVKGCLALLLIGTFFTALAMMFLYLSTIAMPIILGAGAIFKMLTVIVSVTLGLALIGLLCIAAATPLAMAVIGLALLTLVMGLIFLVALEMKALENLKLDEEKIRSNVRAVLDTCKMIISALFDTEDPENKESEKNWIVALLSSIGTGLGMVVQSIMAVAYMATMVASILMILIIATLLRLLQIIDLKPDLIEENVTIIMDTCAMIISSLFDTQDADAEESDKAWYMEFLTYLGGGLIHVVKGIMAVAYLSTMVVSVLMVMLIASILRLLQILDLDPNLITNNVTIIMDTCSMIIDALFGTEDPESEESEKSWIKDVLTQFGGALFNVIKAIMAVSYLATMVVCILLISIIAGELKLIEVIKLDNNLVTQKVTYIMATCSMIIDSLFSTDDPENEDSEKSWIEDVINWFGNGLVSIIKAIMAVGYLATMVVCILLISIIAGELKLIEVIDLDNKLVTDKVKYIMATCQMVIDSLFNPEDPENEESEKSWIETVISWFSDSLVNIVKAIMAIGYLATMVLCILMISIIAAELKMIEKLDLNSDAVTKNVRIVMSTCQMVIDSLFDPDDPDNEESEKSWIETVISWFSDTLVNIVKAIMAIGYLATMVFCILMIGIIAKELEFLQHIELKPDKIKENIRTVMASCQVAIDALFDPDDPDGEESEKSWIVSVLEWFGGTLVNIVKAIMAIGYLATMVFCVLMIGIIAKELEYLQQIDLDPDKIKENVNTVTSTCNVVVDAIMNRKDRPDDPSSKSWIRTLFEWIGLGGLLAIIDCIMALAWLGMSVALINMVTILAQQLTLLQNVKLDKAKIVKNVDAVCVTADAVSGALLGRENPIKGESDSAFGSFLEWMFPELAEAIDMMTKMKWVSGILSTVGVIGQVATILMQLNDLPDVSPVKPKVEKVCKTADEIVRLVTTRPEVPIDQAQSRISWMQRINKTIKEMAGISPAAINKSKKALEGHIKLVSKIDSMKVEKLETAYQMFKSMADFSRSINGDFENLAGSINEKLMPTLEELKTILETIPEKLEVGFSNTSATIAATSGQGPMTATELENQVKRETPNITEDELKAKVDERLRAQAIEETNSVVSKLDNIIDILTNDAIKVARV